MSRKEKKPIDEGKEKKQGISRREFLKDAGFVVGGAAIGSTALLAASCGTTETETVTTTITESVSKFTCPYDGLEFGTLAELQAHMEAEHPEEKLTKIIVNGETYDLKVEPHWTLLDVLRDKLELTGTKKYCNLGSCGFCSVILDGRLVMACMMLATECDGRKVLTIEGMADGDKLHPIQEAMIENMGYQCGFCTPGMIMAAKALLDKNPSPTYEEMQEGMAAVWCRCGCYTQIFRAVSSAAEEMK